MDPLSFETIGVPIDAEEFYQKAYASVLKKSISFNKDPLEAICLEEYELLSWHLDQSKIQESTSFRNVERCRQLSLALIDDKGELNIPILERALLLLQENLYSLGPGRHFDARRQEHIVRVLQLLKTSQEHRRLLKLISKPHRDRQAEQIIRDTLNLPSNAVIGDADARRATLAALLTTLRQNVGSCFATAPCILIHDEQPHLFLKDIAEIFSTGRLKKTFAGIEYTVPLSPSWGAGDLRKPFLLVRSEEYQDIPLSPGIVIALVAAGVIDGNLSSEGQYIEGQKLIFEWFSQQQNQPYKLTTSAEEVIKELLLKHLNLTSQGLKEYDSRPKAAHVPMAMSLNVQSISKQGTKGPSFSVFYEKFAIATQSFKALVDNALLKAWEFTLASFSEVKAQFSTWNLYASLGFEPQEPYGIGEVVHRLLTDKIEVAKRRFEELEIDYEQANSHILYLQTRLRTTRDEQDAEYIKRELQQRSTECEHIDAMRRQWHYKAQRYGSLLNLLIDIYSSLFPQYFQEVYDADMHEVTQGPYDDSPAGFRLIYKYGRSSAAQWTRIYTPEEFIEALASFFAAVEATVIENPDLRGLETDIRDLTSAMIAQIRTQEFLESAFHRMAKAHKAPLVKDPLKHLDQIAVKPWAYTSGGLMDTFVCSYWKRDDKPTEKGRWVENPMELFVFLSDIMKEMPPSLAQEYLKNPEKSMLIHSPTHAFLFKPGYEPFKEAWLNDAFTHTYVRDKILLPLDRALDFCLLDQSMAYFLKDKLLKKIPAEYRHYFGQVLAYFPGGMNPKEFRGYVLSLIERETRGSEILSADNIDSMLYSLLPLFAGNTLAERIREILKLLPDIDAAMLEKFDALWFNMPIPLRPDPIVTSLSLQEATKAIVCLLLERVSFTKDYHKLIREAAQQLGYALPMPALFADTNWVHDLFGFTINPGTGQCELWRFTPNGSSGSPMSVWQQWLNGSNKARTWGVYVRPFEYTL